MGASEAQDEDKWVRSGKESTCNAGDLKEIWVPFLGREGPLKKEVATHSSILTW